MCDNRNSYSIQMKGTDIMSCKAIVLAAADGSRMRSDKPEAMLEVLGEPMLGWVLDSLAGAGISPADTGIIVGYGADTIKKYTEGRGEYRIFTQAGNSGLMQAIEMSADGGDVIVLRGNMPFVNSETVTSVINAHKETGSDVTVMSADLPDPADCGRIVRDADGGLEAIVAREDATLPQLGITEVDSGLYVFRAEALGSALTDELSLTGTIAAIRANGGKAGVYKAADPDIILCPESRADLLRLNITAKMAVIGKLLDEGVEFVSTDGIIIEKNVRIGRDTLILPGTIIRGSTVIGEGCTIGPNSLIENCKIGDGVILNNVQAYESRVQDRVKAGPFVQLRPGTVLHEGVKIGDFVEIKNSEIGVNTAVAHLTYVGDSDVGKGVNFGCGCVTANYDGINKFRTKIGDYAFIGCNTNLIAPVEIGENAATAAGSTITKPVPPDSLAIERTPTRIIEHWEKNSRRIKKA